MMVSMGWSGSVTVVASFRFLECWELAERFLFMELPLDKCICSGAGSIVDKLNIDNSYCAF